MRDINRIPKILNELERIWKANPDFRLGQLIAVATRPPERCPAIFNIEDDKILEGLLSFENGEPFIPEEDEVIPDWKRYSNVSKIAPQELSLELLSQLINELKTTNKKIVITPINLMKLNGAPVSDQTWLLSQKVRVRKLKKLLIELKEKGVLIERESKQGFLGIRETGYDISK